MVRMVKLLGLDGGGNRWTGCVLLCDRKGDILHTDVRRTRTGRLTPDDLFEEFGEPDYVCVDAPMGGRGRRTDYRPCDLGARAYLGPAGRSIFYVPSERRFRAYLKTPDVTQDRLNRMSDPGKKLNAQAFGLLRYTAAAEAFRKRMPRGRVIEGHPEVAFAALNLGAPLKYAKTRPAGRRDRLALLPFSLPSPRKLDADGVDAAVMAHVAWCYWRRRARAIVADDGPVGFSKAKGSHPAIWMP
jgi:hypothetical protein